MAWLYLNPGLEAAGPGSRVEITGDEAKHAVSVARTRVGERLAIGNGRGLIVSGPVTVAEPGRLELEVESVREEPEPQPPIRLAQALAKGDRDELAVQAATELGVAGVVPWQAERSITRWEGVKSERNRARWEAIVREGSKQAIRSRVPEVEALATTTQLAARDELILVLEPTAGMRLSEVELDDTARAGILLVVGPEGGISSRELERLDEAGAIRVRLGSEVLRTSTAGPAALAVLNARLGRW